MEAKDKLQELQIILKTLNLPNKLFYTKAEAAKLIGLSAVTLDRMKSAGIGMEYKKLNGANGRVMYPLSEIARFYFDVIKTA